MKTECAEKLTQENLKKFDEWVENIRKKVEEYYLLGIAVKMDFEEAMALPTGRVYVDIELEMFDKSFFIGYKRQGSDKLELHEISK